MKSTPHDEGCFFALVQSGKMAAHGAGSGLGFIISKDDPDKAATDGREFIIRKDSGFFDVRDRFLHRFFIRIHRDASLSALVLS